MAERVKIKQQGQKLEQDNRAQSRTINAGDRVWVKNFGAGDIWLPGKIIGVSGQMDVQVIQKNVRHSNIGTNA